MNEKIKGQILQIRASGKSNMFNIPAVQRLAFESGYYELVNFIEEDKTSYINFILTGKFPAPKSE
ncbi:MAG: DUF5049 domain-containing protein [Selenomonadaceae bacterium]|nr:DUF5049 domain-containing protein [Selenomonadaceae bacterium]